MFWTWQSRRQSQNQGQASPQPPSWANQIVYQGPIRSGNHPIGVFSCDVSWCRWRWAPERGFIKVGKRSFKIWIYLTILPQKEKPIKILILKSIIKRMPYTAFYDPESKLWSILVGLVAFWGWGRTASGSSNLSALSNHLLGILWKPTRMHSTLNVHKILDDTSGVMQLSWSRPSKSNVFILPNMAQGFSSPVSPKISPMPFSTMGHS